MVQAIEELQDVGVEPDLWKVEGLDRREDCQNIVKAARRTGREKVGCIVVCRGEDDSKARGWLRIHKAVLSQVLLDSPPANRASGAP